MKVKVRNLLSHTGYALALLSILSLHGFGQFSGPSLGASTQARTSLTPTTDPAVLYPPDHPILIAAGDQLTVHLFGVTDFALPERVGLDGSLQVPLIGPVPVLGLTLHQASDFIADKLRSAGMYRDPQVSLQLADSPNQAVTITGEMHGLVPVLGHRGLFSVLSSAGQYPVTGSHTIIINRPGVSEPIVVDLGTDPSRSAQANVPVFAGDTIVVPRTGIVYLLGAFKIQGAVPMQQNSPLTLMQAASLGGGTLFEGEYKDLRIVRTVGFERKMVKVDIKRVTRGKDPDPVLQADDIIFLPSNTFKAALTNGGFAAINSVCFVVARRLPELEFLVCVGSEHVDTIRAPLMRILHVVGFTDPAAGGVSEAIRSLIEHGPPGYEHEVVSVDDPVEPFLATLPFTVHALGPYGPLEYSPRLMPWFLQNRHRFDGVFIHGLWVYSGYAAWRAFRGRVPYAVFPHGMLDPYFKRAFPLKHIKKWVFWIAAQYWILRGAFKVLFTCAAEEKLAQQSFWLHRWNPFVVAFGAIRPEGDAEMQQRAIYALCPQVAGRRFLLFLGRIHRKKGCDLLLEAFTKVASLDPGLDLVMAGPDQQNWQAALMETVAASGLATRVHWTGMLQGDAKWGAFLASEAFILASHQENFGIAVAEALACGRPVLLSDKVNIAPDIAADGAGLMESDTADGTQRLLECWIAMSPADRQAMGIQARKTFLARYDMRSNAQAIVRVFEAQMSANHREESHG